MLGRAEKCLAQKKNAWQTKKVISMGEKCLTEQKRAQHCWKMLGIAEKKLGIAEKCLEEAESAQQRRNAARQSSNLHISEVLYVYLWVTVSKYLKYNFVIPQLSKCKHIEGRSVSRNMKIKKRFGLVKLKGTMNNFLGPLWSGTTWEIKTATSAPCPCSVKHMK